MQSFIKNSTFFDFSQQIQQLHFYRMARRRSNTVGNKLKEEDTILQQKTAESAIFSEPSPIKITIRRTDKLSRIIQMPNNLRGQKLFEAIQKQFYIDREKQILFLKGQRITATAQEQRKTFYLENKDIIHVHNGENINKGVIGLTLAILNSELVKYNEIKITVNCKQVIRHVFEDVLMYELEDFDGYVYVQSGRYLDLGKTFEQEAVENDTIILVANTTDDESILNKLQIREIELIQYNKKLSKRPSLNMEECLRTPNFKKKQKYNVYKSMFVPESKQIIWEEDSNSSFSKKMLIKKLLKKRSKKEQNQLLKQNRIKSHQRISLPVDKDFAPPFFKPEIQVMIQVNDTKRLVLSQCYSPKNENNQELKILKPPPKITDYFFDETEEIQFGEQEQKTEGVDDKKDLLRSAPLNFFENSLKCSVGKSKGAFIPIIAKNSSDDDDDDDDDEMDSDD